MQTGGAKQRQRWQLAAVPVADQKHQLLSLHFAASQGRFKISQAY